MLIEHSLTRRDPDTDETSHCSQKRVDSDKRRYWRIGWNHLLCYKPTIPNIPRPYFFIPASPHPRERREIHFDLKTKTRGKTIRLENTSLQRTTFHLSACFRHKTILAKKNGGKKSRVGLKQERTLQCIFNSRDGINEAGKLLVPR